VKLIRKDFESKRGSVLLLLILAMSVVSLFCLATWHSSMLFHDMSLARLVYEQKFRAAQGGMDYGIYICKKQFNKIYELYTQNNQDFFIELAPFKISENVVYMCKVTISGTNSPNNLSLRSTLLEKEKKCFEISCMIEKKDNKLAIRNWKISDLL